MTICVAVLVAAGGTLLTSCGGDTDSAQVPAYTIAGEDNRLIAIEVDTLPDETGLHAIFDAVRVADRPEGGYFVLINCSTGATTAADNRLANGKFALGALGAAQVGLEEGGAEFEALDDRTCPAS